MRVLFSCLGKMISCKNAKSDNDQKLKRDGEKTQEMSMTLPYKLGTVIVLVHQRLLIQEKNNVKSVIWFNANNATVAFLGK